MDPDPDPKTLLTAPAPLAAPAPARGSNRCAQAAATPPSRGTACMSMPLAMPVISVYCSVRATPSGPPICRAAATSGVSTRARAPPAHPMPPHPDAAHGGMPAAQAAAAHALSQCARLPLP